MDLARHTVRFQRHQPMEVEPGFHRKAGTCGKEEKGI